VNIHWFSNAPHVPSGYGNQTANFLFRLKDQLGHKMSMTAFYGVQGAPIAMNGVKIYPAGRDIYSNDVLIDDAEEENADIVITLMDVWVLQPVVTKEVNWYPWVPIDHDPVPPAIVKSLKNAQRPIAMSKFGEEKLKEAGFNPLYVPHGVDTKIFKPHEGDRRELRKLVGMPEDKFIVGLVMANMGAPSRKAFDQQIRAFAAFHKRHPDSIIYLHTDVAGTKGEDINRLLELADIPKNAIGMVDQYRYARGMIQAPAMAAMYSALDVVMNASKGEGFGIPIIEAQACGTPVIVTDFSAMKELVGAGWRVGHSDVFYSQESYQVVPSITALEDALEHAYKERGNQDFRKKARQFAEKYDVDRVTQEYWKPVLAEIENEVTQAEAARAARTAQRIALRKVKEVAA
jgi:glycosyltransferase involved in cell wall biosynthesis